MSDKIDAPLVSIIIAVYEPLRNYLERALDSCVNQSYEKLEVILVDDGSSAQCAEMVDEVAIVDDRIIVVHIPHAGVSTARNTGIDYASGEFITFIDGDDEITQSFISEAVRYCQDYRLDMVCGKMIYRHCGYDEYDKWSVGGRLLILDSQSINDLSEYFIACYKRIGSKVPKGLFRGVGSKLLRKSVLAYKYDAALDNGEDILFNSNNVKQADRVGIVDEAWYIYYQNEFSAVHTQPIDVAKSIAHAREVARHAEAQEFSIDAYYAHCVRYLQATTIRNISRHPIRSFSPLKEVLNSKTFVEAFSLFDDSLYELNRKEKLSIQLFRKRQVLIIVISLLIRDRVLMPLKHFKHKRRCK